jgi:hypothetical protein
MADAVTARNLAYELTESGAMRMLADGPVNREFGLTYASYFVLPRVLMEHMPLDWQERFVALMREYWQEWDHSVDKNYAVQLRGDSGRYEHDPLANYRRFPLADLEALRNREGAD